MVTYNFHHPPLHMQSLLQATAAEHCARAEGKAQYCFKRCFFSAVWRRKIARPSKIKAPTAGHRAESPSLGDQQWPVGSGCLLCSYLVTSFLKKHSLPSWCEKDATSMMTELAALTFSSKAVRVGSSCSLEKQGVTGYSMSKKGCGRAQGAAAHRPPQTPEGVCPGDSVLFLQLSSVWKRQGKHHPKSHHHPTGALGGNWALDITGNPGHVSSLQYTHDQQFKGWGSRIPGQQLLKNSSCTQNTYHCNFCSESE